MTDRYAVIGNPISHTKSPLIHATFAKAAAQDLQYTAIEGPLEGFPAAVRTFRDSGGRGMNVTAPFKLAAFQLADESSERAQQAGAVNTLKFESGRILVDNFDGLGLVNDIEHNLGISIAGKRVLLLGAGGAARGALPQFLAQRPGEVVLANRTAEKARSLAAQYVGHPIRAGGYSEIGDGGFDLVVNATSASLTGKLPSVSSSVFDGAGLAYELAYGKGLTPFLRLAQSTGVTRLADGTGMLIEQAAAAFFWWRGVRPDTRLVIDMLTIPLI
jgi:shikimate dehydrogenase